MKNLILNIGDHSIKYDPEYINKIVFKNYWNFGTQSIIEFEADFNKINSLKMMINLIGELTNNFNGVYWKDIWDICPEGNLVQTFCESFGFNVEDFKLKWYEYLSWPIDDDDSVPIAVLNNNPIARLEKNEIYYYDENGYRYIVNDRIVPH